MGQKIPSRHIGTEEDIDPDTSTDVVHRIQRLDRWIQDKDDWGDALKWDEWLYPMTHHFIIILRHKAKASGIDIRSDGYATFQAMLQHFNNSRWNWWHTRTLEDIEAIVASNGRFEADTFDGERHIRAISGHDEDSEDLGEIDYTLILKEAPEDDIPEILFYGTMENLIPLIMRTSLQKRHRYGVYLAKKLNLCKKGSEVFIALNTARMLKEGFRFFRSKKGHFIVPQNINTKFIAAIVNTDHFITLGSLLVTPEDTPDNTIDFTLAQGAESWPPHSPDGDAATGQHLYDENKKHRARGGRGDRLYRQQPPNTPPNHILPRWRDLEPAGP